MTCRRRRIVEHGRARARPERQNTERHDERQRRDQRDAGIPGSAGPAAAERADGAAPAGPCTTSPRTSRRAPTRSRACSKPTAKACRCPPTRTFDEREPEYRAMDDAALRKRLFTASMRMGSAMQAVFAREPDAVIPFTGQPMTAASVRHALPQRMRHPPLGHGRRRRGELEAALAAGDHEPRRQRAGADALLARLRRQPGARGRFRGPHPRRRPAGSARPARRRRRRC